MPSKILARRGAAAGIPTLDIGELGYVTDLKLGVIGDGTAGGAKIVTDKSTGTYNLTALTRIFMPRAAMPAGSAALPSVTFPNGAQHDTGFYSPSPGVVALSIAGVPVATFSSDQFTLNTRFESNNTTAFTLPVGFNADRPAPPKLGDIRLNRSVGSGVIEYYNAAGAWVTLAIATGVYFNRYGVSAGTSSAITVDTDDGATTLTDGMGIYVKMHTSLNAGATLNKNGTGDIAIQHNSGDAIANGDISSGIVAHFIFDASLNVWRFMNPEAVAGSGSGGSSDSISGITPTVYATFTAGENLANKDVVSVLADGKVRYVLSKYNDTYNDQRLRPLSLGSTAYNSFGLTVKVGDNYAARIDNDIELAQTGDRFACSIGSYVVSVLITANMRVGYVVTAHNGAPVTSAEITTQAYNTTYNIKRSAPQVVRLGTNRFCVVWWGPNNSADTATNTIHFAVYSVSTSGVVTQVTAPTLLTTVGVRMRDFDIVRLSDGSVAVGWIISGDNGVPTPYDIGSAIIGTTGVVTSTAATHTRTDLTATCDEALLEPWQRQKALQLCAFGDGSFVIVNSSSKYTVSNTGSLQIHRISSGNSYLSKTTYNDFEISSGGANVYFTANFHAHSLPNGDIGFVRNCSTSGANMGTNGAYRVGVIKPNGTIVFTEFAGAANFVDTAPYNTNIDGGGCTRVYPMTDSSFVLVKYSGMRSVGGLPGSTLDIATMYFKLNGATYASAVKSLYTIPEYNSTTGNSKYVRFATEIHPHANGLHTTITGIESGVSPSVPSRKDYLLDFSNVGAISRHVALSEHTSDFANGLVLPVTHPEYNDAGIHFNLVYQVSVNTGAQASRAPATVKVASVASIISARAPVGVTTASGLANNNIITQVSGYAETRLTFSPVEHANGRFGAVKSRQIVSLLGNKAYIAGPAANSSEEVQKVAHNVTLNPVYGVPVSYTVPLGYYYEFTPRGKLADNTGPVYVLINGVRMAAATIPGLVLTSTTGGASAAPGVDSNLVRAMPGDVITLQVAVSGGDAAITLMGFLVEANTTI